MLGETSIAYESWLMRCAHLFRFKIITYVKVTRLWCLTNSFHQSKSALWLFIPLTASTDWGLLSWHEVKGTGSRYGIHILHTKMDCSIGLNENLYRFMNSQDKLWSCHCHFPRGYFENMFEKCWSCCWRDNGKGSLL